MKTLKFNIHMCVCTCTYNKLLLGAGIQIMVSTVNMERIEESDKEVLESKLSHSFIVETHTVVNAKEKAVIEAKKKQALKELTF